jgi:4-hydroxy-3-methylbut-2-enyl diphosphate reductase
MSAFAAGYDVVLFVGGAESSNGRYLFSLCQSVNPRSFFIGDATGVLASMVNDCLTIGITGATSTPVWLLEEVAAKARMLASEQTV